MTKLARLVQAWRPGSPKKATLTAAWVGVEALVLQPDGSVLSKSSAGGADNKLYLTTSGLVEAKTSAGVGDKLIRLSGGNWIAA